MRHVTLRRYSEDLAFLGCVLVFGWVLLAWIEFKAKHPGVSTEEGLGWVSPALRFKTLTPAERRDLETQ